MTYATNNTTKQAIDKFSQYDTDTQLALLWFGYLDIKDKLNPGPPYESENLATAVYHRIQSLPQQEQLQAQRDILEKSKQSEFSREYAAFDPSARIELWLLLGKGMEKGEIVQVPSDYQLPAETEEFTNLIKQVDFEERINFMRSIVRDMGASA